jgi:2-oxoglutarate dehydrogenase E2 component (dihydrolipoamide succinyltransferase)
MPTSVTIPSFGESITEVEIESWSKHEGDAVAVDETLCTLASDKASLDLPSPTGGVITRILVAAGDMVSVGDTIAEIDESASGNGAGAQTDAQATTPTQPAAAPAAHEAPEGAPQAPPPAGPAVRRMLAERGLEASQIPGSGPRGRITADDVRRLDHGAAPAGEHVAFGTGAAREDRVVRMTPIRRKIAERLVHATQTTAMLTTFNEVDMQPVMSLRARYKDTFQKRHGVKLGFMSFFIKAAIEALKAFPAVNAEVRGTDIVYKDWFDVGVAIGGGKGLMVPVIRDADALSFAEIEATIADFGARAQSGGIKLSELQGGTFTISNGGIYGSLLSTPILNPPQSGILGMHKIEQRPVVVAGEIVARPMMYLALTYDHRIVDGREAVQFLVKIKECIEDPQRILLEV